MRSPRPDERARDRAGQSRGRVASTVTAAERMAAARVHQAERETRVDPEQVAPRQPRFEAGREPARNHSVVHRIRQRRRAGRGRGAFARRRVAAGGGFANHRPEHGADMVDQITDRGMAQARAVAPLGAAAPQPVAGGVGGRAGAAGAAPAERAEHAGGQHAGERARAQRPPQRGRVLVVGASGLIGAALAQRLQRAGYGVVCGVRRHESLPSQWPGPRMRLDFAAPDPERWARELAGVDAVINAAGIFVETAKQSFDTLHVKGPLALAEAARRAGVGRFVQISALGADPAHLAGYLASKGRLDRALAQSDWRGRYCAVRPSFVYAAAGASTRWFALLASLPLTPLPDDGRQRIQPIHLDDLCEAVERLLDSAQPPPVLDAVGPRAVTLRTYLAMFKRSLGYGGAFVPIPWFALRAAAGIGARIGAFFLAPDNLRMLAGGNTSTSTRLENLLGRRACGIGRFVAPADRARLREDALRRWILPCLRGSVSLVFIATGAVSLWVHPREDSLALLARTDLHGAWAQAALHAGAWLDIALGLAPLLRAHLRRWAYAAQAALMTAYTVLISAFLPEFWSHPYGPMTKNLPLLAVVLALFVLDSPHGRRPR